MPVQDKNAQQTLSIVVFSGTYDKIHYALAMAAAASAIRWKVTLFFTMHALPAMVDNGRNPGWHTLPYGDESSQNGHCVDQKFAQKGIGTFEDLLQSCSLMNVTFMVCETGLAALDLSFRDLRADIAFQAGGIVSFLHTTDPSGRLLFI